MMDIRELFRRPAGDWDLTRRVWLGARPQKRLLWLWSAALIWILAGCGLELDGIGRSDQNGLTPLPHPTLEPTPTLVPGLPTSTPAAAASLPTITPRPAPGQQTPSQATAPADPPTATPPPREQFTLGQGYLQVEDYSAAVTAFQAALQAGVLNDDQTLIALSGLAEAYRQLGQYAAAAEVLGQLLSLTAAGSTPPAGAYFTLGQVHQAQGDCAAAIGAYDAYLVANPDMAAYVQPLIGQCHVALGDPAAAVTALEAAVSGGAHRLVEVPLRQQLAQIYLDAGDYTAAVAQYDAILAVAQTENTRGQVSYQAGQAELQAGNEEAGYARYLDAVNLYPQAYESYLALVALIEAGYAVDEFQRGLVDFHAKAYEPAVTAFLRYLQANPVHREDTHLYLAWSYEALGNYPAALNEIDTYIEANTPATATPSPTTTSPTATSPTATSPTATSPPASGEATPGPTAGASGEHQGSPTLPAGPTPPASAEPAATPTPAAPGESGSGEGPAAAGDPAAAARGWIERAKLQARAGRLAEAVASYSTYLELFPAGEEAAFAAWWAAAFTERQGDTQTAIERYVYLADNYPAHADADEALFRAGVLASQAGDEERAGALWQRVASEYPGQEFGSAAVVWLLKAATDEEMADYLALAGQPQDESYYALRANHIVNDIEPFEPAEQIDLTFDEAAEKAEAETWLSSWLGLGDVSSGEPVDLSRLSDELAQDGRLIRGQKLWRLGLRQEAKRELESLRQDYAGNPLASYQLALFFRDLGLYRSSIIAASSIIHQSGGTVFTVPRLIGRLAYPTYYSDLVLIEAEKYGFDPLLQFALIRQESLYESFATSSAVAQGLSQVIPDTGLYIAQRLGWPDYKNEDLYRPYVGVAFGAYYLNQQLEAFDNQVHVALSAYNGGPGNAARWYRQAPDDPDLYLETVDFAETRSYIERIYVGQAIYRYLYGQPAE
jgi:soluble lytic murein transglycosylase